MNGDQSAARDWQVQVLTARLSEAEAALGSIAALAGQVPPGDPSRVLRSIRESLSAHGYRTGGRRPVTSCAVMDDVWGNLVSLADVAARCGVAEQTVRNWIYQKDDLPVPVYGGKRRPATAVWWWPDLLTWLEDNRLPRWSRATGTGPPGNQRMLTAANTRRSAAAAAVTAEQARRALDVLGDDGTAQAAAGRLRLQYPDVTLAELGALAGVSKDTIAGRLRRLLSRAAQAGSVSSTRLLYVRLLCYTIHMRADTPACIPATGTALP